jgi:ankyrin repeat protein
MSDPLGALPIKSLPTRPNLEQYKKQAKELLRDWRGGENDALARVEQHAARESAASLTNAQLVIAREHGFASWQKFAVEIERLRVVRVVEEMVDPVAAFLKAAVVPTDGSGHAEGTLDEADAILKKFPKVATANVYTAAVLGNEATVRGFLAADAGLATAKGGHHGWDALTYLCFSRYMRLDEAKSDAFVKTARALLEGGADANTAWWETIDLDTTPRQVPERVIYGAAAVGRHAGLTQLLLDFGADPNDEETPYHVPESYDNTIMELLLKSGKFTERSKSWLAVRKADWHDYDGMKMALDYGADPNMLTRWGITPLQHSIQRDNRLEMISLLFDHGANPLLANVHGRTGAQSAVRRGRGDVLKLCAERGIDTKLNGLDRLIAACAMADDDAVQTLITEEPGLRAELLAEGGMLLAQFAGVGNAEGIKRLLDLGVKTNALYSGDAYFGIPKDSTALHVAAWRGESEAMKALIERGAPVNALDGAGLTALQLAVRACVESYWKRRRTPEWVEPLLKAGASLDGVEIPCGYAEVDELLKEYAKKES